QGCDKAGCAGWSSESQHRPPRAAIRPPALWPTSAHARVAKARSYATVFAQQFVTEHTNTLVSPVEHQIPGPSREWPGWSVTKAYVQTDGKLARSGPTTGRR